MRGPPVGPGLRCLAATCAGLGLAAWPGRATAGEWSLHFAVDGYLAATDNVFAAADEPAAPGAPAVERDGYAQLRPSILYTYEAPRAIHELSAELDATGYARHTSAWALAARGAWRGFFVVSPRTEAGTSLSASFGESNTLTASTPAGAGQPQLLPPGAVDILTLAGTEHVSHAASEFWQVTHDGNAQLVSTSAPAADPAAMDSTTRGVDAGVALGVERSWLADAVGGDVGISFNSLRAADVTQQQVLGRATLRWRHDLGRRFTTALDGGVATLVSTDVQGEWAIRPTVGAQLTYVPDWGTASLALRRTVAPNLFIAQNTVATGGVLSAMLPLPWLSRDPREPELALAGTLAYERTELLDLATDATTSTFDLASADVALTWMPSPGYNLGLRYQFAQQTPRGELMAGAPALAYQRNTVLLAFSARWPERPAGEIPKRSGRVDRRDVTPITGEL